MKKIIVDGNEACARASYLFTEIAGIYPITPSSPMPKNIDVWANKGYRNIFGSIPKVVEMQSEAGAIGMCHGTLLSGNLASTYTSSQGLLLMIPNMHKIAGEMLPFVMHVSARSLATHALSIFGDHQDIYSVRNTGFCMLASSSVQDAYYMSLISHLSSISSSIPFVHFFDGFRTSHELSKIDILSCEDIKPLVDYDKLGEFRDRALNSFSPVTMGTNQNPDVYFQITEGRNKFYKEAVNVISKYMDKINSIANTDFKPFNYYGNDKASKVIVAMGSVCETIKETIDYLGDYGLIEVHLYRPFCKEKFLEVLPESVKKVAVLSRTKEFGSTGEPLYLDVLEVLKDTNIEVVGGRYGLSGKDTTPSMIKAVYDMLDNPVNGFTVGINDDVTNLSLKYDDFYINNCNEILIYGYGSDGMVSAGKSLINILGEDKYVQGYFEYDSKKSGGVTTGHLRYSDKLIKSSYCVYSPNLIIISKDSYLDSFDVVSKIAFNGKIFINSSKSDEEILNLLNRYKKILNERCIEVYAIDAGMIASKYNLGRKISMIMLKAIFNLLGMDKDSEIEKIIHDKFDLKSSRTSSDNIKSLKDVSDEIRMINLDSNYSNLEFKYDSIYEMIKYRRGNDLKVSDLLPYVSGVFKAKYISGEGISDKAIFWISSNCTQCGMCSLVCPHGVIRPYILNGDEYEKSPKYVKERCLPLLGNKDYYYVIGISVRNCTGCGLCEKVCPGFRGIKALIMKDNDNYNKVFDYLDKNISEKFTNKNTIKGSQNKRPKFAFHGACAGCGETPYIKLLTQITDGLIVANATGCSSIYGGDLSNLPYSIPWASSLFEDNAEFGFGMLLGYENKSFEVKKYMLENKDELFDKWLSNPNDFDITKYVYDNIDYDKHKDLVKLKPYIVSKKIWAIGGDGWAYDIGFGGIDHVLSSSSNINILVLNTESYSNTGGQMSKATPIGAVAEFAYSGKKTFKKDLARIAMSYPGVYVAQINLGANMVQAIKAINEANNHVGPSIIIAYCPCIAHGIEGGMCESINIEKLATECGYFPIFRYDGKLSLDCKEPNFELYEDFLNSQARYRMLKKVNKDFALDILNSNKDAAIKRYNFYKSMLKEENK